MIAKYRNGHKRLGDLTIQNISQCDKTISDYDYIEIGDVDVGNATYCSAHLSVDDLPANARIMAHKGDLIISKVRPNRGAVAIIEDDRSDLVVSGAFTVVAPKDEILREYLLVLLRTNVYRDWLLRWAVGSSYPVVKDEDVLNMPIPLFDKDIQQKIAAKVRESFALRAESKRLLDLAKHAVEVAIEQGEEKAMDMISTLLISKSNQQSK
jgi:type I restriction enzyme S subunit